MSGCSSYLCRYLRLEQLALSFVITLRVELRDRYSARPRHQRNGIAGPDLPGLHHLQIKAGGAALRHRYHGMRNTHPDAELETGRARLRHFQHRLADQQPVSHPHLRFQQALHGQVFSHRAGRQRLMAQKHTAALLFPKSIMLDRIGIHGLERSAMLAFVGMLVAVQAEFAGHDRSCERPLVDRACDVARLILFSGKQVADQGDIDADDFHWLSFDLRFFITRLRAACSWRSISPATDSAHCSACRWRNPRCCETPRRNTIRSRPFPRSPGAAWRARYPFAAAANRPAAARFRTHPARRSRDAPPAARRAARRVRPVPRGWY